MNQIVPIDVSHFVLDLRRDFSVTPRATKPGPPERLDVVGESDPGEVIDLAPGGACIVRKGEWHRVMMLEPAQLIHITPGPRGDYRPL